MPAATTAKKKAAAPDKAQVERAPAPRDDNEFLKGLTAYLRGLGRGEANAAALAPEIQAAREALQKLEAKEAALRAKAMKGTPEEADLLAYAKARPDLFSGSEIRVPGGGIIRRNNPPSVGIEDGEDLESACDAVEDHGRGDLLKITRSLDKAAIKRAFDGGNIGPQDLEAMRLTLEPSQSLKVFRA